MPQGLQNPDAPLGAERRETPPAKVSRIFSVDRATLYLLSLTSMHLQVGTANQRHPLFSSESSQHISRNKKKEHQWQNKEQ